MNTRYSPIDTTASRLSGDSCWRNINAWHRLCIFIKPVSQRFRAIGIINSQGVLRASIRKTNGARRKCKDAIVRHMHVAKGGWIILVKRSIRSLPVNAGSCPAITSVTVLLAIEASASDTDKVAEAPFITKLDCWRCFDNLLMSKAVGVTVKLKRTGLILLNAAACSLTKS